MLSKPNARLCRGRCWLVVCLLLFVKMVAAQPGGPIPAVKPTAPAAKPTPAPKPTAAARPTAKPTVRPTPRPTPKPTPKPTVAPRPTPTAVPTPTSKPTPPPLPTPVPPPPAPPVNIEDLNPPDAPHPGQPATVAPPPHPLPGAVPGAVVPPPTANAASAANAVAGNAASPSHPLPADEPLPDRELPGDEAPTVEQVDQHQNKAAWFDIWNTFEKPFMQRALAAGLLVAVMCSFLGVYVVLKRIVFIGVALAEMSSAGIALGLLVGGKLVAAHALSEQASDSLTLFGAALFMLLGVVLFSIHWSPRRVPHDSYIGILYAVAAAVGILFISKSAQGEGHMLTLLQGNVLTVRGNETQQMLIAFLIVAAVHVLCSKEFVLVSFDREYAATLGFRAAGWDFLLFLTIGVVIAFAIRSVGLLMTTTMLILPAASALLVVNRLRHAWIAAPLLAIVPVVLGLHISFIVDLPSSAVISALSFLLFLPVLVYSRLRH